MVPNEATETQEKIVQKVEAGDVITIECRNICCEGNPNPTQKAALILEVQENGNILLSAPDHLQPTGDVGHLDGNGNMVGENGSRFEIVDVKKGAGAEIVEQYEKYAHLRSGHLHTDMSTERFNEIIQDSNKDLLRMLEVTMDDGSIVTKTHKISMVFDLIGIKATEEQLAQATCLMAQPSDGGGMPGGLQEALIAAMMGGGL